MSTGSLAVTVVDHEKHRSKTQKFTRGPVRVGRDPENELHLAYRFVSSWHAVIRFDALSARVEDLGTVNGLSVEGVRVAPGRSVEVRGRLVVAIGPLEIIVEHTPGETKRQPAAATMPEPTPSELLGLRDRVAVQGAIDTDEPPILSTGHTQVMNLSKVHAAVVRLRPLHDELVAAQAAWTASYDEVVREMKAAGDESGLSLLRREFPTVGDSRGGPVIDSETDPEFFRQAELGAVAQAAEELVQGLRGPGDIEEVRRFLTRVSDILRTFAASTVEQLATMERQDAELGVVIDRDQNPVLGVESAEELLRLLLDWRGGREDRTHSLVEALACALAHPAAVLRGALAAGRRVSERLAPRDIERSIHTGWPTRAGALWRGYEERYEAVLGDGEDGWARALRSHVAQAVRDALARAGLPVLASDEDEGTVADDEEDV